MESWKVKNLFNSIRVLNCVKSKDCHGSIWILIYVLIVLEANVVILEEIVDRVYLRYNIKIYTNAPPISEFTFAYLCYKLCICVYLGYSCLFICLQNTLFVAFVPILLNYSQSATNYLLRKYLLYRSLFAYNVLHCSAEVAMLYSQP